MSQFSGKCDLYDTIYMHCNESNSIEDVINKSRFYMFVKGRKIRLHITSEKELGLYYPFLISMGSFSDDKIICYLSTNSFIDEEEKDILSWVLKDTIKEYKKCKRKKQKFIPEEIIKKITFYNPQSYKMEIVNRVAKDGDKATIDGVHDYMHEYYRKKWFKELVKLGWTEQQAFSWVYKEIVVRPEDIEKRLNAID